MKFLIVFAVLIAGTFATYELVTKEKFVEYRNVCAEENHLTPEQIADLVNYSFPDKHMPACYIECMFKKMNFYHDGHFIADNVAYQLKTGDKDLNEDALKEAITTCSEEFKDETDNCKKVLSIGNCFYGKYDTSDAFKESLNEGLPEGH